MRHDLTDLRLVVAIVEAGSITGGAARCHLALPSASARLRGLEDALGVALFERHAHGVVPTPAGLAVVGHARAVAAQLEQMADDLRDVAAGARVRIGLLCNSAARAVHLPPLLAAFLVAHPQVDLDIEERSSQAIVDAIASCRADLGVLADAVDHAGLASRRFVADPLVVIEGAATVQDDRLPARAGGVAFADVLDARIVALEADDPLQAFIERQARRAGRGLRVRVRARDLDGVVAFVARGVGVAIVPDAVLARTSVADALRVHAIEDAWAQRTLHVCARSFDALPPAVRALADALAPP